MGKSLKAYSDLDLDLRMLNIELVLATFIYYNVFQFYVPRWISFWVTVQKHKQTHTHTHTHTHRILNLTGELEVCRHCFHCSNVRGCKFKASSCENTFNRELCNVPAGWVHCLPQIGKYTANSNL